jgi:two-component system, cell cycle sensor histidine kinase and response regulator CckA
MKIRTKLGLGFGLLSLMAATIGFNAYLTNVRIQTNVDTVTGHSMVEMQHLRKMTASLHASQIAVQETMAERYRLDFNTSKMEEAEEESLGSIESFAGEMKSFHTALEAAKAVTRGQLDREGADREEAEQEELQMLERLDALFSKYERSSADYFTLLSRNRLEAEEMLEDKVEPAYDELAGQLAGIEREVQKEFGEDIESISAALVRLQRRSLELIGGIFLISLLLGYLITRSITSSVAKLKRKAGEIGEGHFDTPVKIDSRDEMRSLGEAFNKMSTDLVRLTEGVRLEKERLTVTLLSIGDGVIATDEKGAVHLMNAAAEEMTGWMHAEAQGRPVEEILRIVNEDTRQTVENPASQVLKTGDTVTLANHTLLIARDGQERMIADSGAPIRDMKGRVIGAVIVFRDVTGQRKLEEQLMQAQKMQTVGTLAGGVAHDLNNQLTPIRGYLDLLMSQVEKDNPLRPLVNEANQAAIRCADIVQRLVSFSRKKPMKRSPLDPKEFALELHKLFATTLPATIQKKVHCESDVWNILANANELQSLFMNLAVNAQDAMPEGGAVSLEIKNTIIANKAVKHSLPEGRYVVFSMRDSGKGMPASVLKRIFEPFFTTKSKSQGTGLGLAMVFKTVMDHEGWIDVSSEEGRGSIFQIYLPAFFGENEAVPVLDEGDLPRGSETVLVADDEERVRDMAKAFLERLGYNVLLACDGAEAVEIYLKDKERIHILVLDMTMPKLTGRQTLQRILEIEPKARVVLASGYTVEGTPEELMLSGAKGFLEKPYTIAQIAHTMRDILDRH